MLNGKVSPEREPEINYVLILIYITTIEMQNSSGTVEQTSISADRRGRVSTAWSGRGSFAWLGRGSSGGMFSSFPIWMIGDTVPTLFTT